MPQILLNIVLLCFVVFTSLGAVLGYFFASRSGRRVSNLEAVTECLPNISLLGFDKGGKIFFWSRGAEFIYGHSRNDAIGKQITDIIVSDEQKAHYLDIIKEVCLTKKSSQPLVWQMISRSGEKKTIYSVVFPNIKAGNCREIYAIDIDISELKKKEDELTASREVYKGIFSGVNEAIFAYDVDLNKILDANEVFCKLFEYSKDEMLNLTLKDISYGEKEQMSEKIKAIISKAFYEGPQIFEWLGLTKSGKILPLIVNIKKNTIEGNDCILAIVRDMSSQKRSQDLLRRSERRYSDLLNNSMALIFTISPEGVISTVNSAVKDMMGYEVDEVVGKHFGSFLNEEERGRVSKIFSQVVQERGKSKDEVRCMRKDGREAVILLNSWAELDESGNTCGLNVIAIDITEQKLVMERIREMIIQIVSMLSETVSVADRYTEKHCERIQEFALAVGKKLELDEKRMEHLKFASLLHDVGKVGIPINILIKKGRLTEEEWRQIKDHPKKGADIVRQLEGFEEVAQIIEQHQERVDGKGYPGGLTQGQIKKEATIISVVDAFDAMTSDRPYRKAMSIDEAIDELRKNAGTQFDPEVVEAFIAIIKSNPGINA